MIHYWIGLAKQLKTSVRIGLENVKWCERFVSEKIQVGVHSRGSTYISGITGCVCSRKTFAIVTLFTGTSGGRVVAVKQPAAHSRMISYHWNPSHHRGKREVAGAQTLSGDINFLCQDLVHSTTPSHDINFAYMRPPRQGLTAEPEFSLSTFWPGLRKEEFLRQRTKERKRRAPVTAIDLSDTRHMCRLRRRFLQPSDYHRRLWWKGTEGTDRCPFGHNVRDLKRGIGDCGGKGNIALVGYLGQAWKKALQYTLQVSLHSTNVFSKQSKNYFKLNPD